MEPAESGATWTKLRSREAAGAGEPSRRVGGKAARLAVSEWERAHQWSRRDARDMDGQARKVAGELSGVSESK